MNNRSTPNATAEQQLQHFVDCVVDYAFILFDPENRITGWNTGAERLTGFTESEALGQHGGIVFTPEDRAKGEVDREIETARTKHRAENERWHVRKDGTQFWGSGVLTRLLDENGNIVGFAKVMRDLTARQTAVEALARSEERFRLFVDNVRDYALIQTDPEGRVAIWSNGAERLFGYMDDQIVGQPLSILFSREDAERGEPEQELVRARTEGRAEEERWMVRRDGSRLLARWVTTPMYDHNGQLRGFAKVLEDVSRRKEIEDARERLRDMERTMMAEQVRSTGEALDRTQEELRALTANLLVAQEEERRRISRELHDDIAQRLGVLDMETQQLRQALPRDVPQRVNTSLKRVQEQLGAISEGIRSLSHRLHPAILDDLGLEAALGSLVDDFQRTHRMNTRFVSSMGGRTIPKAVAAALYRITQEALRNAAKHARGASMTVSLLNTESGLRLTIRDEGPGFDLEDMRRRGGLGLVSMQERAKLVGGAFLLDTAPGRGTEIHVRVPIDTGT